MSSGQGRRAAAGEATERQGGRIDIDAARSRVGFRVRKMGLYFVKGRFRSIEGSIETDDDGAPKRGELTIDVAASARGSRRVTGTCAAAIFSTSPTTRRSRCSSSRSDRAMGRFDATATFTIRRVSAPVELQGNVHGERQPAALHMHGTLDRHAFGIRARRPFEWIVGREVQLDALVVLADTRR
jgi:polyisoprenoid-binding protein YceI